MVTIAELLSTKYPVSLTKPIELQGWISGNYGEFNRNWFKTSSANILPGMGVFIVAAVGGDASCTEWGANAENGYGFVGWDKTQLLTQVTNYASGDLCPVFGFSENPGAYFQGRTTDTTSDWDAGQGCDAAAGGFFDKADLANKVYADALYFVVDTATVDVNVVLKVAMGGAGG